MHLHPVALLSLAMFIFAYSIRKSRLVRILKTHSLHSIRTHKSQKVAFVCDVAFEQYRSLHESDLKSSSVYVSFNKHFPKSFSFQALPQISGKLDNTSWPALSSFIVTHKTFNCELSYICNKLYINMFRL